MLKIYQQTLSKPVIFEGVGLHSGKGVKIKVLPGNEDQGIIFKRVDLEKNNLVYANYKYVSSTKLCTTLENNFGVKVSTVEHLLAALYISEIDNAIIEIDNIEVPIMDGSAKDFIKGFKEINLKQLSKKRKYLKIIDRIKYNDKGREISIEPSNAFKIEFKLNYNNKIIGSQENSINLQNDNLKDIYNSRTFCLYEDIKKIKETGLAQGGSLENAIVVNDDKVLNNEGLRNQKEFVNHKILDLVGDFLLSGFRVLGKVKCYQGGHEFTNSFLKKMMLTKSAIKSFEFENSVLHKKTSVDQPISLALNAQI